MPAPDPDRAYRRRAIIATRVAFLTGFAIAVYEVIRDIRGG
jgi:hypothetical protein